MVSVIWPMKTLHFLKQPKQTNLKNTKKNIIELQKRHFKHLDFGLILNYLTACKSKGCCSINVLLYGPSGTGKTQLSRLLAKHSKSRLYSVDGEVVEHGFCSSSRAQRITLAQRVLARKRSAMLCVDECENLFEKTRFFSRRTKLSFQVGFEM